MIPEAAIEAAAKWLHDHDCRSAVHSGFPADFECYDWLEEARELLEAAAPHVQSRAIEELAEARNEDDTTFIFTWGQRDWMRRHAVDIRTTPHDAHTAILAEAVDKVARQLTDMAEREERLLAEGLQHKQDRISATAHAKAWRTAARLIGKVVE